MAIHTLPSLVEWTRQHLTAVFEAMNEAAMLRAIEETFSPDLKISWNGITMGREHFSHFTQEMRLSSLTGLLTVHWQSPPVVAPKDPSHRCGWIGAVYVVRGARKEVPGREGLLEFEQHKCVNVVIESVSDDPGVDSRRIMSVVATVADLVR